MRDGDQLNAIRSGVMGPDEYRVLNLPRARVIKTTGTSVPASNAGWGITSNTAFILGAASGGWDTIIYDTDNMVNLTADDSAITCRTPGMYQVGANFDYDSAPPAFTRCIMDIYYNNSTTYTGPGFLGAQRVVCRAEIPTGSATLLCLCTGTVIPMNPGDTIRLRLFQQNAGVVAANSSGATDSTWFQQTMYAHMISTL